MARRRTSAWRMAAPLMFSLVAVGCGAMPASPVVVTITSTVSPAAPAPTAADSAAMTDVPTSPAADGGRGGTHSSGAATAPGPATIVTSETVEATPSPTPSPTTAASTGQASASSTAATPARPPGEFTLALAGDVNFSGRTADLLAEDPATALREAADELDKADITMVNLETAITTRGTPAPKEFHFRAPATALTALAAGGVDVATMANNHAVDYGAQGLTDTLAAIDHSPIPVIGIGADAAAAYAPFTTTVNGVRVAIIAASQVRDWTLGSWSATDTSPGIADADSDRLIAAVAAAKKNADVVVVYLHWGIEYSDCPSSQQRSLAARLAKAGVAAIVGTHAHVLLGAGWRDDGSYVAYGLGNYYWWRSFGNEQDDNGVLTLTFRDGKVTAADFLPTHLDSRGVPLVATGAQRDRILDEWTRVRRCANLSAQPLGG